MTYLRKRAPGGVSTIWVTVGVRGQEAAEIVVEAKSYAQARGVTFGSLLMQALSEYMDSRLRAVLNNTVETNDHA